MSNLEDRKNYIDHPIDIYKDFDFVNRETCIYPKLVGSIVRQEIDFVVKIIKQYNAKNILDLGVGGGKFLSDLIARLDQIKYNYGVYEANEIDPVFVEQAKKYFSKNNQQILIHQSNRLHISDAQPSYTTAFDFCFLLGNSLTYLLGKSREEAKQTQKIAISNFAKIMKPGAHLLIDTRDYDYIQSISSHNHETIMQLYSFDYTTMYHGAGDDILVVPGYISDTLVVLHYYNEKDKERSKLDLYPIYHQDILDILEDDFIIEDVFYDFGKEKKDKCILRQYLARRR